MPPGTADLSKQAVCGDSIYARNSHQELDFVLKRLTAFVNLLIEFCDFGIKKSQLIEKNTHLETVPLFKSPVESQAQLRDLIA
ncbi:MAG TPA: hypothetical protein VNH18_07350 [Bryobacteraceae bacterium]|nr:hypothetical protein [Bryobacteraceae bacterium]